jgi:hypothetical protein
MNGNMFMANPVLRDQYGSHTEVLGEIINHVRFLPGLELATIRDVGAVFGTEAAKIRWIIRDHLEEFEEAGLLTIDSATYREYLVDSRVTLTDSHRGLIIEDPEGNRYRMPKTLQVLSLRGILRLAMFLPKSSHAQWVRMQLATIAEKDRSV